MAQKHSLYWPKAGKIICRIMPAASAVNSYLNNCFRSIKPPGTASTGSYATKHQGRLAYRRDGRPSPISISLSHSANWFAAGIAWGARIGVDIEEVPSPRDYRKIASYLGWKVQLTDTQDFPYKMDDLGSQREVCREQCNVDRKHWVQTTVRCQYTRQGVYFRKLEWDAWLFRRRIVLRCCIEMSE